MNDIPRQGFEDEPVHEPGTEFEDPFLGPNAAVEGSLEEVEAARRREQDERDALIEDDSFPRPWEDESPIRTPLVIACAMAEEIGTYVEQIEALYEHGLDRDTLTVPIPLNMLSGGLVVGALQLAGVLVPTARDAISATLTHLDRLLPKATPEEIVAIEEASSKALQAKLSEFKQAAAERGVTVIVEGEEDAQVADDDPGFDARNN